MYYEAIHYTISFFVMFLTYYLLILKPQKNQSSQIQALAKDLTPGTLITTSDGRQGRIINVLDQSVIIQYSNGSINEVFKHAISSINIIP